MSDRIIRENARFDRRTDKSYWNSANRDQIEGVTTKSGANGGQAIPFTLNVNGDADLGSSGRDGAREFADTISPDDNLGLVDVGISSISAEAESPTEAVVADLTVQETATLEGSTDFYRDAARSDEIDGIPTSFSATVAHPAALEISTNADVDLDHDSASDAPEVGETANDGVTFQTEPLIDQSLGLVDAENRSFSTQAATPAAPVTSRIVAENARTDGVTERSYWDASHSNQIEGFTTDFSVNAGQTVSFKINVNGNANDTLPYKIEIFRLGFYGGSGAREVAEIVNADGTVQPAALFEESLGLVDAGNWSISDQWQIPADAVSGVYLARVQRLDLQGNPIPGATNQIPFIVRNDGLNADIVLQTSDTTWHAYNGWAGNNGVVGPNFYGDPANMVDHDPVADPGLGAQDRAYAVSYNRPFLTRDGGGAAAGAQDYLFGADYAALFWLEQNGYDVSYMSGVDTDRLGVDYLDNYKAFISVGHDEYWSGDQRANVEAARDAGVNLLFWSGNEVYWKTRWEDAISADGTAYRTLVCYKETWANRDPNAGPEDYANIDPTNIWTGTWRDVRFLEATDANGNYIAGGSAPDPISGLYPQCHCAENTLTGQLFGPDGTGQFGGALDVPADYGTLRYWRDTAATNGEMDISPGLIGYEWDVTPDDENRPEGLIRLSATTLPWNGILVDQGNRVEPGIATHNLTLYRAESGALVFASGTVFWSWGLSDEHDSSPYGASAENALLQQFTVNMFADMGIQPQSLQANLSAATASTDLTPATITINDVPDEVTALSTVTISGTATDVDGNAATTDGVVALVELSFDGGTSWRVATGTTNWTYNWRPTVEGEATILVRAVDDSLNVHNAVAASEAVTVADAVPPGSFSLFDPSVSVTAPMFTETSPIELGMRFTVDRPGEVTQLRYYRGTGDSADTDVRDGHLWRASDGALLGTVTFTSQPGESGWQIATLSTPIGLVAGAEYIVSYRTANNYVSTNDFFAPANEVTFDGFDDGGFSDPFQVISAPEDNATFDNGMFSTGSLIMPNTTYRSSNYWVDFTFAPADAGPNTAPVLTSADFIAAENQSLAGTVTATDSDGNALTYGISGGADAVLFSINATTGSLTFRAAPDFEAPGDAGADNIYNVIVSASDSFDVVTRATTVTITNVNETTTPTGSTIFVDAPTSSVSGNTDATNYELGTKFLSSEDGTILALRYYRVGADSDDTDVRTLNLWDQLTGTLLGSVQVTSTPGQTGWQIGTLTTPISIVADRTYIVSYSYVFNNGDGNVESYAATPNHFVVSRAGSDGILTAPASGVPSGGSSGGVGNGLYFAHSPGSVPTATLPTNSFNASNYWADVIFQAAGTGSDNEPPVFTSAAVFNALENQTTVGQVTATDADFNALTFSIAGGADAAQFTINAVTGRIELKNPQDFEGSADPFDLTVAVSDGTDTVTQAVTINLTDVDETADGPSAMTGATLQAQYIFGSTPTSLFPGAGATQTATVGPQVEFPNLPSAGSDVGNGDYGLATVQVNEQTIRIEYPLDPDVFTTQSFVRLAGPSDGRQYNGVLLTDVGTLAAIRSVRIIGQEGFTNSTGQLQPLTASDLTITENGIFLNVADKGRLVDVDPDTPGAQAAWVELLVELNDAPVVGDPIEDQQATADSAFSFTVPVNTFTDVEGDALSYSATLAGGGPLPAWLSFDPVTRTLSGTPGSGDVGSVNVTVTANDGFVTTSDTLVIAVAGSGTIQGSAGNDNVGGSAGTDMFMLQQGGEDTASGGDGNDGFFFGAALSSGDVVDGGAGAEDQVGLQGSYAGFTINAANFEGIETFGLLSGTDTRFGAPGTDSYSYNLTTSGSFGRLIIFNANSLSVGESFTFVGAAEETGTFIFFGGQGTENLTGGGGSDGFYFGPGNLNSYDTINGGGGSDNQLGLHGDYVIDFGSAGSPSVTGIQTIALLSGTNSRFGQAGDGEANYHLTLGDGLVSVGQQFTVTGTGLGVTETIYADGSAELDGSLRLYGGQGSDRLIGGAASDSLYGGLGADTLTGGAGADRFFYQEALESTTTARDSIQDFEHAIDTLDLSVIDANSIAADDQAFTFIGATAFSATGASSAGQLRAELVSGGLWQASGDVDGDGIADFDLFVTLVAGEPLTASDFLL